MAKFASYAEKKLLKKPRKNFSIFELEAPLFFISMASVIEEGSSPTSFMDSGTDVIYVTDNYELNKVDKARCALLNECTFIRSGPENDVSNADLVSAMYACPYCSELRLFDRFTDPLPKAMVLPRRKS